MRSDVAGVNHHAFHVGIAGEVFEHGAPDASFGPAVETFVDRVPVAVLLGEKSPLDATSGHLEDGVDEAFAIGWFADVKICSGSSEFEGSFPLVWGELDVGHSKSFSGGILKVNAA